MRRRRRGRVPLERVGEPRVVAGPPAVVGAGDGVEEEQHAGAGDHGADRRDHVVRGDAPVLAEAGCPGRLALVAEQELHEEGAVEPDEEQPRRPRGGASAEQASEDLGPPVRQPAEQREQRRAPEQVVGVGGAEGGAPPVAALAEDRERERREESDREQYCWHRRRRASAPSTATPSGHPRASSSATRARRPMAPSRSRRGSTGRCSAPFRSRRRKRGRARGRA